MGLFSRPSKITQQIRNDEQNAADYSRRNAAQAEATGGTVHGIDAAGWRQRAEKFQGAADNYGKKNRRR